MKYEISDVINDKYIYGLTILRIHKKIDKSLIFRMILKIPITTSFVFFLISLIFNSIGIIILSCDFIHDYNSNNIYLSKYIRFITPLYLLEKIYINNHSYLIICSVLMFICILRSIYCFYLFYKMKNLHISEVYNIKIHTIIVIINHLSYIFFSYIVELLSFIYYIEFFPNSFIIKKSNELYNNINRIYLVLNILFIFIYNFYNFLFFELVNTPNADKIYPFQMRIPKIKIYFLILLQNTSILQPLPLLLNRNQLKLWNIIISIIIIALMIIIYFIS